ncbi:hypothetical protein RR48_08430 [Papilio machaon]|uniref:Uncharacterized protein n=1 Tax=Papilio machaon TaxID=76193 RepID=A0A194QPI6_PAPMA|nr:hypothetical protein RR48_08430 [Papilio machaon]
MLLPDQRYERRCWRHGVVRAEPAAALASLLRAHRVRPEFFCVYRSRWHAHNVRFCQPVPSSGPGDSVVEVSRAPDVTIGTTGARSSVSVRGERRGGGQGTGTVQYARDRAREWSVLSVWCGAAAVCDASGPAAMATLGLSKVFILDKYFTELQKFWETEKKLQGERRAVGSRCGLCRCCHVLTYIEHSEVGREAQARGASPAARRPPPAACPSARAALSIRS